jgi:hypothetical protein
MQIGQDSLPKEDLLLGICTFLGDNLVGRARNKQRLLDLVQRHSIGLWLIRIVN